MACRLSCFFFFKGGKGLFDGRWLVDIVNIHKSKIKKKKKIYITINYTCKSRTTWKENTVESVGNR